MAILDQIDVIEGKEEYVYRTTTEEDVRNFFEHRGCQRKLFDKKDKVVLDINFGYDNGGLIERFQDRGKKMFEHYKIGHEIRYWRSRAKTQHREISEVGCYDKCCTNEYTEKREEKLLERRALIDQQMNEMERQTTRERNTWIPLSAFVSFDTERDYVTALQDMKFSVPKRLFHFIR